ncbi:MAG: hypothetical protein KA149_09320, partial [Chitinophagales bacterium]|nr:hypothetical protein [Chitinophagales bacterium]
SSNTIYRIEQDEKGWLWLSSDYGLMRFDTGTFAVKIYTTKDGLAQNEFDRPSSFRAADGRMVFGGVNGVNAFYPSAFWSDSSRMAPLQVVSFQQYNGKLNDLTSYLLTKNKIVVTPQDKFFILQFALLDYDYNSKHQYAYKIEGVDATWNFINENSIRISGLPAGEHVLYIRAQNQSGRWAVSELKIPITVIEPLIQRTWFRIAVGLALLILLFVFIRYRTYRLTKAKEKLERTVEVRTNEIRGLLGEKDILLKEIHHRVKNNLQIISNLLDMQGDGQSDEKTQRAFNEAKVRVRSVALIHQNLYQQNNLSGIDLHQFTNELIALVEQLFKQPGKNITINNLVPAIYMDIDTAVPLGLILNELLTNAYKYAFNESNSGAISIQLLQPTPGAYQLIFADSGPGLSAPTTFESADTLGLRLIKRLAVQLMGRIEYTYQNGSCFAVYFKDLNARKAIK